MSAHSGQASDEWFMNQLRSPNCGCGAIIQPHRCFEMFEESGCVPGNDGEQMPAQAIVPAVDGSPEGGVAKFRARKKAHEMGFF
jgi:hypothetical protein